VKLRRANSFYIISIQPPDVHAGLNQLLGS